MFFLLCTVSFLGRSSSSSSQRSGLVCWGFAPEVEDTGFFFPPRGLKRSTLVNSSSSFNEVPSFSPPFILFRDKLSHRIGINLTQKKISVFFPIWKIIGRFSASGYGDRAASRQERECGWTSEDTEAYQCWRLDGKTIILRDKRIFDLHSLSTLSALLVLGKWLMCVCVLYTHCFKVRHTWRGAARQTLVATRDLPMVSN